MFPRSTDEFETFLMDDHSNLEHDLSVLARIRETLQANKFGKEMAEEEQRVLTEAISHYEGFLRGKRADEKVLLGKVFGGYKERMLGDQELKSEPRKESDTIEEMVSVAEEDRPPSVTSLPESQVREKFVKEDVEDISTIASSEYCLTAVRAFTPSFINLIFFFI